jgi:hypothetical protein
MTLDRINKAKALAEAHGGKSGKIILDLVAEIERLRKFALRRGTHPVSVTDPWPYKPHYGVPLCEVPEDYLLAWAAERRRNVLLFDWGLGVIAKRDLALFDLIVTYLGSKTPKDNGQPDIKTEEPAEA